MAAFAGVRLLAVVALVALLGSACGNDDDASAEAPAVVVTEAPATARVKALEMAGRAIEFVFFSLPTSFFR